jgi:hypothetical protein
MYEDMIVYRSSLSIRAKKFLIAVYMFLQKKSKDIEIRKILSILF